MFSAFRVVVEKSDVIPILTPLYRPFLFGSLEDFVCVSSVLYFHDNMRDTDLFSFIDLGTWWALSIWRFRSVSCLSCYRISFDVW